VNRIVDPAGPRSSELEKDPLEFRLLESAEITDDLAAEMLAVFRASFGQWPFVAPEVSQLDYLRWKMSGPASPLGSFQGRLGGRLVYSTVAFANWFRIKGARRLQVTLLDACVPPAAQGQGIFSRAVAHESTMRYRCDFSIHERVAATKVRRRMVRRRQRLLGNPVKVLSRILAPSGPPAPLAGVRRMGVVAASFAGWALGSTMAATRRRPSAQPRNVAHIDARFDILFERAAASFDVIAERTAEFLSWRYGDLRGGRFVIRELSGGEELAGYYTMRIVGRRAYLTDLLVLPGCEDAVEPLVVDAVALAEASSAAMIDCWLPRHHPYRAAFRRQGFFDRGDAGVRYLPVELPAEELAPLEDRNARIHYTLGDTDLV
jgi:hypothetical protein